MIYGYNDSYRYLAVGMEDEQNAQLGEIQTRWRATDNPLHKYALVTREQAVTLTSEERVAEVERRAQRNIEQDYPPVISLNSWGPGEYDARINRDWFDARTKPLTR